MKIRPNSKLLMVGDSVTDCGRKRPIGEGNRGELGNGYVLLIDALLNATYPDSTIRVVNMGISGNTSQDLEERWEEDVIAQKAEWVSILIGINDIWRKLDSPTEKERHISVEAYQKTLEKLVKDLKKIGSRVVLMTPFFMETQKLDVMRSMTDEYGVVVKKIAHEYQTLLVDLQAAFDRYLESNYSAVLSWDRVHPNTVGHMIIAKAFLNTIDYRWGE